MMSKKIDCVGCCFMTKGGVEVYRCDQKECPFYVYFFVRDIPKVDTCFT